MALYQCIKFHYITFNIFYDWTTDKSVMAGWLAGHGQTDGQTHKVGTICSLFGEHNNNTFEKPCSYEALCPLLILVLAWISEMNFSLKQSIYMYHNLL